MSTFSLLKVGSRTARTARTALFFESLFSWFEKMCISKIARIEMSPINRSLYPVNWDEISRAIRQRANWKCEKCGVKHGTYIMRLKHDPSLWYYTDLDAKPGPDENKIKVILTVHHVGVDKPDGTPGNPSDKMDCRSENLQALCQRCHLIADRDLHIVNRRQNRAARHEQEAAAAGQLRLELE